VQIIENKIKLCCILGLDQMRKNNSHLIQSSKKEITPIHVRDAIINCFYEAHEDVLNEMFEVTNYSSDEKSKMTKYNHIRIMIKTLFNRVNGDFNNPDKDSLIKVIDQCAQYAQNYRDDETIEKNYNKIMDMINKLD